MKHGALRQRAGDFVNALHAYIGPELQRTLWKIVAKVAVRPVRFVHHQDGIVSVADFRNGLQVACDAVIRRADDEDPFAVRVHAKHLFHGVRVDASVQSPFLLQLRHDIGRVSSAEYQAHQGGFVGVSGNGHGAASVQGGQNHRLIPARGPVDEKVRIIGTPQVGSQLLRLADGAGSVMQVVQQRRFRQIKRKNRIPHSLEQNRVDAIFVAMSRYSKIRGFPPVILHQCVEQRCSVLVVHRRYQLLIVPSRLPAIAAVRRKYHYGTDLKIVNKKTPDGTIIPTGVRQQVRTNPQL